MSAVPRPVLLSPLSAAAFDHAHAAWDALLHKHVVRARRRQGLAACATAAWRASARLLKAYLDGAVGACARKSSSAGRAPQQMAFLINAYNAFTVEKILTRYPDIGSIWDFGKFFGNPFKDGFFTLLGSKSSLDHIEHEHPAQALRRAAHPLRGELRLDRLPDAARGGVRGGAARAASSRSRRVRFLSDRARNRYRGGRLEVSKIFDWYKEDFEPSARSTSRATPRCSADRPDEQQLIVSASAPLSFLDYDWSLNDSCVVVPALNEAAGIRAALQALAPLRARGHEVIVVDGGSDDGTPRLAARALRSRARRAARPRAADECRRARGAAATRCSSCMPTRACRRRGRGRAREPAARPWGRFDVRIEGRHPLLKVVGWAMNLRSRLTGIATGDQAIFVRRDAFPGFPEIPLMEDVALQQGAEAPRRARLPARRGHDLRPALGIARRAAHHRADVAAAAAYALGARSGAPRASAIAE